MARRQYPQLDSIRGKRAGKPCACCGKPDTAVAWVQWSYMRGEDEDYPVCDEHRKLARSDFPAFIKSIQDVSP